MTATSSRSLLTAAVPGGRSGGAAGQVGREVGARAGRRRTGLGLLRDRYAQRTVGRRELASLEGAETRVHRDTDLSRVPRPEPLPLAQRRLVVRIPGALLDQRLPSERHEPQLRGREALRRIVEGALQPLGQRVPARLHLLARVGQLLLVDRARIDDVGGELVVEKDLQGLT